MSAIFVLKVFVGLLHCFQICVETSYVGKDFEIRSSSKYDFLTGNISEIVCSIDVKLITICFQLNFNLEIVDEIFRKTLDCVPNASIEIIR